MQPDPMQTDPSKLRELASWYRNFAERAGNPAIWESRLRTAEALEARADLVEQSQGNKINLVSDEPTEESVGRKDA